MRIDMWMDTACPWCYLGLRHLRAALSAFPHADQVEVVLRAHVLEPDLEDPVDTPRAAHLARTTGVEAEAVAEEDERLRALGRAEGVVFDFESLVVAPTSRAHRVIAAAGEADIDAGATTGPDTAHLKAAEAIMRAHFEMGLDVSDPDVLIGCAQDIGLGAAVAAGALADGRWASQVYSDHQMGVGMGVDALPTYILGSRFVVQDRLSATAMANVLTTAWAHSREDGR